MAPKKTWSDLSTGSKALLIVTSIVELVLTSVALTDLRKREPRAVRGPKWVWRLLCLVQPVGPVAYLVAGRRDTDS